MKTIKFLHVEWLLRARSGSCRNAVCTPQNMKSLNNQIDTSQTSCCWISNETTSCEFRFLLLKVLKKCCKLSRRQTTDLFTWGFDAKDIDLFVLNWFQQKILKYYFENVALSHGEKHHSIRWISTLSFRKFNQLKNPRVTNAFNFKRKRICFIHCLPFVREIFLERYRVEEACKS